MVGTRILEANANITMVIIGFCFLQKLKVHRLLKAQSDFQMRMVLYPAKAVVPLDIEKMAKIWIFSLFWVFCLLKNRQSGRNALSFAGKLTLNRVISLWFAIP